MLRGNCFWRREDVSEWNKCKHSESVREQRIALYKSNQQHHTTIAQHSILRYYIPHVPRHISQTFNVATTIFYIWPRITPQSASHHHFTLPHLKAQHITQCTSRTIPHWTSQHISQHYNYSTSHHHSLHQHCIIFHIWRHNNYTAHCICHILHHHNSTPPHFTTFHILHYVTFHIPGHHSPHHAIFHITHFEFQSHSTSHHVWNCNIPHRVTFHITP